MMLYFLEWTGVGDRERPVVVALRKEVESGLMEMLQGQGGMMKTFLQEQLAGPGVARPCCTPPPLSPHTKGLKP